MEPSIALQAAIRARFVSSSAVTALVPAANILDRNGTPALFPCILIGEAQSLPGGDLARRFREVFFDLHIWAKEPGTMQGKFVASAMQEALKDTVWNIPGIDVADLHIASTVFMRDPGGQHSHTVMKLSAIVWEAA